VSAFFLLAGCSAARRAAGPYRYTPPATIKKDKPSLPIRALLFPFKDNTKNETVIEKTKISVNFLKKGHLAIPRVDGETLARSWGEFLTHSKTFAGIGLAFGDSQDRRGQIGLGGTVVQAQYLIEEPVCLLRIRVNFEARRSGEDQSFWRADLFESGKCSVDAKDARRQRAAVDDMLHALFTKALQSLENGLEAAAIAAPEPDPAAQATGTEKPVVPVKKPVANDSVVDELYRQALEAQ